MYPKHMIYHVEGIDGVKDAHDWLGIKWLHKDGFIVTDDEGRTHTGDTLTRQRTMIGLSYKPL